MRNTITLNGKPSTEIAGLLIESLPPISKPLMRTQIEEIDGRDGDIVTPLGFSAYTKQFKIGLYGDFDINEVIAYFNSEGTVIFSNEPDKYYYYEIIDQIDFERLIRFRTATVSMHCQPFKYSATEGAYILEAPAENFLNIPNFNKTTNGITVTVQAGTITVKGTGTAATEFYVPTGGLNLPAGSYTLTASATGRGATSASIRLIKSAPSNADTFGGNYITLKNAPVTISDTLSASTTYNYLWFYINGGVELNFTLTTTLEDDAEKLVSDEGTFLTLENSAEAPFSQLDLKGDTQQTTYSGKNLFNYQTVVNLALGGTIVSGDAYRGYYIQTTAGNTFTLSRAATTGNNRFRVCFTANEPANGVAFYDENSMPGQFINADNLTSVSFTVPQGMNYVFIYLSNTSQTITESLHIQLETGSSATSWEKFVGGVPAPNPSYPQDVNVVTGEQTVEIVGKNLLPIEGGYIKKPHSTSADVYDLDLNGTFTVSADIYAPENSAPGSAGCIGMMVDEVWNYILIPQGSLTAPTSASLTRTGHITKVQFTSNGAAVNRSYNEYSNIQLEAGSSVTDYTPYQSSIYEINLGKNLFDISKVITSTQVINNNDGTLTINTPAGSSTASGSVPNKLSDYCPDLKVGDVATLSFTTTGTEKYIYLYGTGANFLWGITPGTRTKTITQAMLDAIVLWYANGTGTTATISDIQVELGSTATPYVPYMAPIELCKIGDYQDYIYKSGSDWYVHKVIGKAVLTGSEDWQLAGSSTNTSRFSMSASELGLMSAVNGYCNSNVYVKSGVSGDTQLCGIVSGTLYYRVNHGVVGDTDSLVQFKAWAASNNIIVYTALATPTDTKITNATLIEQLDAIDQNATAYKGRTHIISTSDGVNLPHIIAASVAKDSSGDITNAGNTYSKPKLTIYGSGNIAVYLNGVQVFQIALGDEGYITIDTAAMEAYKDTPETLKNRLVTGDYNNFALPAGSNEISFTGAVTKCIVENYSRWL